MTSALRALPLLALVSLALPLLAACSNGPLPPVPPGTEIDCNGVKRVTVDCSSEIRYQGVTGEAGVSIMNIAGISGKLEESAIRQVSEQVQQFVAMQTRNCRDYNACILDPEQYRREATDIRERMTIIPALVDALKSAKSESERMRILDKLYRGVVPDEKRTEEITFQLRMIARLPERLGGNTYAITPGAMVPTDARTAFEVWVSKTAYVYMFQTTAKGGITVLFPDPRIGTRNPLSGGLTQRIPYSGQAGKQQFFRVNEQDIGVENVYFVVSGKQVSDLDSALEKVKSEQVTAVGQSPLLQQVVSVAPTDKAAQCKTRALELVEEGGGGCSRPRGLELTEEGGGAAPPGGGPPPSMVVRSDPTDDTIVRVFPFNHVTQEIYAQQAASSVEGKKTRGIIIED
ncbi:MAG: DUF4384 domain-containing protein [Deltaproteobacteria bacterium]|nr:DUF4384 domain-containing protein [Deltaproteobacteria bacterium]